MLTAFLLKFWMVHDPARNMLYLLNHSLHQSDIFITSSYFYFKYSGQFKTRHFTFRFLLSRQQKKKEVSWWRYTFGRQSWTVTGEDLAFIVRVCFSLALSPASPTNVKSSSGSWVRESTTQCTMTTTTDVASENLAFRNILLQQTWNIQHAAVFFIDEMLHNHWYTTVLMAAFDDVTVVMTFWPLTPGKASKHKPGELKPTVWPMRGQNL